MKRAHDSPNCAEKTNEGTGTSSCCKQSQSRFHQGDFKKKWIIFQILEKMGSKAKSVIPELSEIVKEKSEAFNRLDFGTTISDLESLDYCEEIIELIKKLKEAPEGSAKLIF
jgi:glycyl-tRNA synthetase alpha subunit